MLAKMFAMSSFLVSIRFLWNSIWRLNSFLSLFALSRLDVRRLIWSASAPRSLRDHYRAKFDSSDAELENASNEIVRAVQNLAKTHTGALIVLTSSTEMPGQIIESGTRLDAVVSAPLLESLFFHNSTLHDGAVAFSYSARKNASLTP